MHVPNLIDDLGGPSRLGAALGCKPNTVATWRKRKRIPPAYWPAVARLATAHGLRDVTLDAFCASDPRSRAALAAARALGAV